MLKLWFFLDFLNISYIFIYFLYTSFIFYIFSLIFHIFSFFYIFSLFFMYFHWFFIFFHRFSLHFHIFSYIFYILYLIFLAKVTIRSSIFNIFDNSRQDQRKWSSEARFSPFSATGVRSPIFDIFGNRRQNQRKWLSEARFSTFSATGARISENDNQKLDFQFFQPQAPGSAKMIIRSSICTILGHRRQDQRKWPSEAPFSIFSTTGARIIENDHHLPKNVLKIITHAEKAISYSRYRICIKRIAPKNKCERHIKASVCLGTSTCKKHMGMLTL